MGKIKIAVIIAFAIILTLSAVFFSLNRSPVKGDSLLYTVEKGDSIRKIAEKMEGAGIIKNADFLIFLTKITGKTAIRAGRYRIHQGDGSMRILNKIVTGEVITSKVTIPEGYNLIQIADALSKANICDKNDFLKYSKDVIFLKKSEYSRQARKGISFLKHMLSPKTVMHAT